MRVALLSNMNNNYFGLLRYLVDLGIDTRLFLCEDEHSHFLPENDTWNMDRWRPFIDEIPVRFGDLDYLHCFDRQKLGDKIRDYDILIGSGPVPAYLEAIGRHLDIFAPYKVGVEYLNTPKALLNRRLRKLTTQMEVMQRRGIGKATCCLNWDLRDFTMAGIRQTGVRNEYVYLPLVYPETVAIEQLPPWVAGISERLRQSPFVVCHSGRHRWGRRDWKSRLLRRRIWNDNGNEEVLRAFADFVFEMKAKDARLLLFEYGTMIEASKQLIRELRIEDQVVWAPLSSRKVLMYLNTHTHIGIGDIKVGAWGGKSIEFLCQGVPVVNSLAPEFDRFERLTGVPLPPFIRCETQQDLKEILCSSYAEPAKLRALSKASREWWLQYEGVNLAKKIVKLAEGILRERNSG